MKTKFNLKQFVFVAKTMFAGLIMFLITFYTNAENKEVILKSKIEKVTVFLNSAQVFRSGNFSINSGTFDLVFEGVSPLVNNATIQVNGSGNFTILDVKQRLKPVLPAEYVIPLKITKDIKILEDSLQLINYDIEDYTSQSDVLKFEKRIIENNKILTGGSDTIPEIKEGLNYLRIQLFDINKKLLELNKTINKLNSKKQKIEEKLNNLKSYNSQVNPNKTESPVNQIVITVNSPAQTNGKLEVSYIVESAGWSSTYDIRAESSDKPLKLIQKANIYQSSGEDWNDVKLTLSTITPSNNNVKPYLQTQYLSYYQYNVYNDLRKSKIEDMPSMASTGAGTTKTDDENIAAQYAYDYTQTVQTLTNVEYSIPISYSIPSDGEKHIISVQNLTLKTDYTYYLTPKIDNQAFLVAKVTDFENYELLPGSASIFFNGSFVGTTNINTSDLNDTLELTLGRDRSIIAERKKFKEENKNVIIGANQVKTLTYNINIKNNKLSNVNIIVTDQIPISNDKEIIVKPLITKDADFDETTGLLTWKLKINSNETKNLKLSYSIESNRNKQLVDLN